MAPSNVRKVALAFLKTQKLGAFSTATSKGLPEVAMMYFGVDQDLTLYVVTGALSRKIKNLGKTRRVAMAVAD